MLYITFTNLRIGQVFDGTMLTFGLESKDFKILLITTIILFAVSLMQENGIKIRESLSKQNLVFRWGILYIFIFMIIGLAYQSANSAGGFMYAQF